MLTSSGQQCPPSGDRHHPIVVRQPSGYMSSDVAVKTGYGSASCPWSIRVSRGQQIELFLLHFRGHATGVWDNVCISYGHAQAGNKKQALTVCGDDVHQRARRLYKSEGNVLTVLLETEEDHHFLLHYEGKKTLWVWLWWVSRGYCVSVKNT